MINLSKGQVGEDVANMIGSLLVTKIQLASMKRAKLPSHKRVPFSLYIDEFQNFTTQSFATILSESRKYNLSLVLAHQYLGQLQESVKDAVFGNVGTIMSFALGYQDAQVFAQQYRNLLTPQDFLSLPDYTGYVQTTREGKMQTPFCVHSTNFEPTTTTKKSDIYAFLPTKKSTDTLGEKKHVARPSEDHDTGEDPESTSPQTTSSSLEQGESCIGVVKLKFNY